MEHESDYSEFVKKLIDAVREQPCIYDKKHASYFNKFEREKAWYEIAVQVGQSADDCQKRWKLLREKLAKELKKRDRFAASGETYHSDWSCFEKIVFIEDHIMPRKKLEMHPYFFVPIDYQESMLHPRSDSNNSSTSSSFVSDHQQLQSQLPQSHQQDAQKQQQPKQSQHHSDLRNVTDYQQFSGKRLCQRKSNRSSSSEFSLLNDRPCNTTSRSSSRSTHLVDDHNSGPPIKEEPNEISQTHDLAVESDPLYKLEITEGRSVPTLHCSTNAASFHRAEQPTRMEYQAENFSNTINSHINTAIVSRNHSATSGSEDTDTLFGKMVTAMLKDIPLEEHKDDVKLHIMQMLIKAKRAHN